MPKDYSDLLGLLAEATRSVRDNRYIWCVPAEVYETRLIYRRGLLLGGSWSPLFLRDKGPVWWEVPWTLQLRLPAIVMVERATAPLSEWLPLMEATVQAGESLLVLTKEVSAEILQTFIVNSVKETLSCCIIRVAEDQSAWGSPAPDMSWEFVQTPPKNRDRLLRAGEAWVRRTGTVVFPAPGGQWQPAVEDIAVIAVGGRNRDDQHDRMRFLVDAIENP